MAASTSSSSVATLRQLKGLVILLTLSNIAIGVFGMLALRQADARYSELLDRSVPVLNDLQTLTAQAAEVMVTTNVTRLSTRGADGLAAADAAVRADRESRAHLIGGNWVAREEKERGNLKAAGETFTAAAEKVLQLVRSGQLAEATRERDATQLPAFQHYLDGITATADTLQAESERSNDRETARISRLSALVLGVASWPLLALGALLLLTAAFVLVLMVLFRGREMSDMP